MNKQELIKYISSNSNLNKTDVETSINGFIFAIKEAIANGDNVDIEGFGKIKVSKLFSAAEISRHRLVKELNKKIISFKPSKSLIDDVA